MLKINGSQMPTPSDYKWGEMDLSKAERNARGTLIKEIIATKRKLEMSWKYLPNDELQQLLQALSNNFFDVEFVDPHDNRTRTGTFYAGDRSVGALDYINGVPRWVDIKCNIIER